VALAARCGDGAIVLLQQGDPPHQPTDATPRSGRRIVLKTAERQPIIESDQTRVELTVTPTTNNLVDVPISHTYILPADYAPSLYPKAVDVAAGDTTKDIDTVLKPS
jgi:hypothetical protein